MDIAIVVCLVALLLAALMTGAQMVSWMAETAIEVCDARPSYVEAHVDEFVDNVTRFCPWNTKLVNVEDLRERAAKL